MGIRESQALMPAFPKKAPAFPQCLKIDQEVTAPEESVTLSSPHGAVEDTAKDVPQPNSSLSLWNKLLLGGMLCLSLLGGAGMGSPPVMAATNQATLRVLTLNDKLDAEKGVPGIVDAIRKSRADVVGLQESSKKTGEIAGALHYNYVQQTESTAILSRYTIEGMTPGNYGAILRLDSGDKVVLFNVHLYYKPYQPYQLTGIKYEGPFIKTEAEAISEAKKARGADVEAVMKDISAVQDKGLPLIVTGDFNEPSFLDWTAETAHAGRHPIKVEWPSTKAFAEAGFKDSFRTLYPDVMKYPGFTWTPDTSADDLKDHHDRIDFVLYRGKGIEVRGADIVGENDRNASIVVTPYPSDHRGVVTTFEVSGSRRPKAGP
jgi:exodeoxyribonuclease III